MPEVVAACAPLISSPFFSVDAALRTAGVPRIVEIGDGQVCDRKQWPVDKFVQMLQHVD